jgi:cell division protein FtsL
MKNNFFQSPYFIFCLLVVLVLIVIVFGRESYHYFKVAEEVNNLEQNIENLKKENEDLIKNREYFQSQEFLEDEARKKLNMVKEGETVVMVTNIDDIIQDENANIQKNKISNFKLWLEYFK